MEHRHEVNKKIDKGDSFSNVISLLIDDSNLGFELIFKSSNDKLVKNFAFLIN